jgi:prophage regulatory protein
VAFPTSQTCARLGRIIPTNAADAAGSHFRAGQLCTLTGRMTMKILRLKQVVEMTGLSRSSIYRHGPPRRQVGPNAVGWLESDVMQWIQSRPPVESPALDMGAGFGKPPAPEKSH